MMNKQTLQRRPYFWLACIIALFVAAASVTPLSSTLAQKKKKDEKAAKEDKRSSSSSKSSSSSSSKGGSTGRKLPANAPTETGTPIMWRDPGDIASKNLIYGIGSPEGMPKPPFQFKEED